MIIFLSRNKKGKFGKSVEELRSDETFFEYTRMTQSTFDQILDNIDEYISMYSNFRECISPNEKSDFNTIMLNHSAENWINILMQQHQCNYFWKQLYESYGRVVPVVVLVSE